MHIVSLLLVSEPGINRNLEADAAVKAGVNTVMNMSDREETMKNYEGYAESCTSALDAIPLNLGTDFSADDFRAGLVEGFRFLSGHKAACLIHCNKAKDRTGLAVAEQSDAIARSFMLPASFQSIL